MLHLLSLTAFALQLHPGHLACFHTTNTCNYIAHLFLAEVTKQRKVLQVLKCFEIRNHSHTKYKKVLFFLNLSFSKLFQTSQTT